MQEINLTFYCGIKLVRAFSFGKYIASCLVSNTGTIFFATKKSGCLGKMKNNSNKIQNPIIESAVIHSDLFFILPKTHHPKIHVQNLDRKLIRHNRRI